MKRASAASPEVINRCLHIKLANKLRLLTTGPFAAKKRAIGTGGFAGKRASMRRKFTGFNWPRRGVASAVRQKAAALVRLPPPLDLTRRRVRQL